MTKITHKALHMLVRILTCYLFGIGTLSLVLFWAASSFSFPKSFRKKYFWKKDLPKKNKSHVCKPWKNIFKFTAIERQIKRYTVEKMLLNRCFTPISCSISTKFARIYDQHWPQFFSKVRAATLFGYLTYHMKIRYPFIVR